MIEIESFLRSSSGRFTPVAEAREVPGSDPLHIEGAIDLKIDYTPILDTTLWDDVDQLWAYIGIMVGSLADQDEVSTYFPDQPIELKFRRQGGGRLLVSVTWDDNHRAASVSEHELVTALQGKGAAFFTRMMELVPENAAPYANAVARLMSYRQPQGGRR